MKAENAEPVVGPYVLILATIAMALFFYSA